MDILKVLIVHLSGIGKCLQLYSTVKVERLHVCLRNCSKLLNLSPGSRMNQCLEINFKENKSGSSLEVDLVCIVLFIILKLFAKF